MNITTKTLSGAEICVAIGGQNTEIRNDGAATVYASANPDVVAGADGVVAIPAGAAVTVLDTRGRVYLLGTGEVSVVGKDTVSPVFHKAPSAGGSGDAVNYSNPNLLINPDFRINQRGESAYSGVGYTADMWKLQFPNSAASIEEDGYKLGLTASAIDTSIAVGVQTIEEPERFCGRMVTLSVDYKTVVSNRVYIEVATSDHSDALHVVAGKFITEGAGKYSVTGIIPDDVKTLFVRIYGADRRVGDDIDAYSIINYAKLEIGSIATPFTPPDPATELAKCQRYYQIRSTGDIAEVDLRPSMRATPTITQLSDGNYAYSAEL